MCEATKQMKTILEGEKETPVTKSILIFAQTVDKSLTNIETQLIKDRQYNKERFEQIITMLEKQSEASNKRHEESLQRHKENNERLDKTIKERKLDCYEHKMEINKRFENVEKTTEDLNYFKRHPKILKIISVSLLIIIAYALGNIDIIKTIIQTIFK